MALPLPVATDATKCPIRKGKRYRFGVNPKMHLPTGSLLGRLGSQAQSLPLATMSGTTKFIDIFVVVVVVYLDDIIVYSQTEKDHIQHIRRILTRLREAGLYLKLSKCRFHAREIILGLRNTVKRKNVRGITGVSVPRRSRARAVPQLPSVEELTVGITKGYLLSWHAWRPYSHSPSPRVFGISNYL